MSIPKEVTIYAAGFFDGEGSVFTPAPSKRPTICVAIAQNARRPLDYIQEFYGGTLAKRNLHQHNGCHVLTLSGTNARNFLRDVFPYCLVKEGDIKSAFDYAGYNLDKRE
jgi:hypothetical protein